MADLSNSNLEKLLAEIATPRASISIPARVALGNIAPDLAAEVLRLRKALEFFVGEGQENVLQDILWKDASDDATIRITLAVGKFRQARAALDHKDHSS